MFYVFISLETRKTRKNPLPQSRFSLTSVLNCNSRILHQEIISIMSTTTTANDYYAAATIKWSQAPRDTFCVSCLIDFLPCFRQLLQQTNHRLVTRVVAHSYLICVELATNFTATSNLSALDIHNERVITPSRTSNGKHVHDQNERKAVHAFCSCLGNGKICCFCIKC